MKSKNPILVKGAVPAFDLIKPKHFNPAIDRAIANAKAKLASLKNDRTPPTYANAVVPLDTLFTEIRDILSLLECFYGGKNDKQKMDPVQKAVSEKVGAFEKLVFQDHDLAARFKAAAIPADRQSVLVHKNLAYSFETNGAFLAQAGQARLKEIDEKLIDLCNRFEANLEKGAEQEAVLFTDPADIAGLPPAMLAQFKAEAKKAGHKNGWLVKPERLQVDMMLEIAESRDFRQKMFEALNRIGTKPPYDNEPILKDIHSLRHERSVMLGYKNYASYALTRTMAGDLTRAQTMLEDVAKQTLPKFEQTVKDVTAFAIQNGGPAKLEPWDLPYWANRYRQAYYAFDAAKFSDYLKLENVVDGFFKCAEKIFRSDSPERQLRISFRKNDKHPKYHPDVDVYDVVNPSTNEAVGILYVDLFARKGKRGGAWMSSLQRKSAGHLPIVSLNMNLTKPTPGTPTLLSIGETETTFHEGGHSLHGLLGTETDYESLQGPAASSDAVEFHSTIMENWAMEEGGLRLFAKHYQTGAPLPDDLLDAMKRSRTFFSERDILKVIQNSLRDFAFHTTDPADYKGSVALEKAADLKHPHAALLRAYPLARFSHLYSEPFSGYAAGYYGYLWAIVCQAAGFEPFQKHGLFDPASCQKLTKFFGYGASCDSNEAFEELHGGPAGLDALFRSMGILPPLIQAPPPKTPGAPPPRP